MAVYSDGARCRQDVPGVERCVESDVRFIHSASEFFEDLGAGFRGYCHIGIDCGVSPTEAPTHLQPFDIASDCGTEVRDGISHRARVAGIVSRHDL